MHLVQIVEWIIGSYFVAAITWSYSLLISAHRQLKREDKPILVSWPSVTVLIPAYNEELCIVSAVEQVLYMNYPGELNVSICDDGSTDNTLSLIQTRFGDNPRVSVVSQPNGGRAAAVNGALANATGKYVVATDADTIIDTTSFQKIIYKMETDSTLEAVGGSILLSNNVIRRLSHLPVVGRAPTQFLAGTQAVEYIRAFLYGRLGLNKLGGNVIISGAFGVFRRETVLRLGGWDKNTVAEDFEMTVKIRHAGGKVLFIPDPTAWTEVPNDLRSLSSQRERWHRGLSQIMWRWGKKVMFRPSQKSLGMVTMPTYFVFEWLAPFIELSGYMLIVSHAVSGNLSWTSAIVLSIAYVMWVMLSVMSIRMEQKHFNRYRGIAHSQFIGV
jgi:cellulose synthase/poly-beta-1,6-N-acetylglucosamine synthase-like glycosyltransferase